MSRDRPPEVFAAPSPGEQPAEIFTCRGWRPAGAADSGHLHEPPDDVTREAAHVPFAAVPDCRQEPPVVCAPPPVPAALPQ